MVQSLKAALYKRREKNRTAFLARIESELDGLYDFIFQVFADEQASVAVLQSVLRKAMRRSRSEQYEKYLHLWLFRLAIESIQKKYPKFIAELLPSQEVSFVELSLEEKLVLFLHDRRSFSYEETAAVLQLPVGRIGRSLTYAREKVAKSQGIDWSTSMTLLARAAVNRELSFESDSDYEKALCLACKVVQKIPARNFSQIETSIKVNQILPILGTPEVARWQDLPWQYKLGMEASALGLVGLLAVIVLPWAFAHIDAGALVEGRFANVLQVEKEAMSSPELEGVTAERLLASANAENADMPADTEEDEFANVEFPSGDAYEAGSAPAAPSRQQAAVYRLIVQSPSPKEMIPYVRTLFAQKNVKERESSGKIMPGGVYFDGITSVGTYPQIVEEMAKLGVGTKTYSNPGQKNRPHERARVIVWVQQI